MRILGIYFLYCYIYIYIIQQCYSYHVEYYIPSTYFGEGNGTPLQYSCLENPMDGGAW